MRNALLLSLFLATGVAAQRAQAEEPPAAAPADPVVGSEMDVGIHYTLTVDGVVVDSTSEQGPWHYIHGHGQLLPALERQLEGLHVGGSRQVTLSPADGYGEVDASLFEEIPKSDLPAGTVPAIGMVLRGVNSDGQSFQARIAQDKPDTVMLDLNHPLAGKTLHFGVTVTDITPLQ